MIVSPRAEQVIDVVRKEVLRNGDGSVRTTLFVEIDEVYLYRRTGNTFQKVLYWKRGEESTITLPGFSIPQE
jgi:hypothetical protein